MAWFKVDDSFHSHPKIVSIPRGATRLRAVGLWTSLGTWCAQHLTDGLVPRHMVDEHGGTRKDAQVLVDAGLWEAVEGGYQFHDWEDWQPTRKKVEADRREARDRMARNREQRKKTPKGEPAAFGDVRPNTERTSESVRLTPTRPDPSRPNNASASASTSPPQADDTTPPPIEDNHNDQPPGPIAVLAAKMARHTVFARLRWDGIPAAKADRLVACIDALGDAAMVDAALKAVRPTDPPTFGTGFLGTWEALATARETGRHLRVIEDQAEPCTQPGHTGTTARCTGCIVDARVGDA